MAVEYKIQNRTIYIKLTSIYDPYGEVYEWLFVIASNSEYHI